MKHTQEEVERWKQNRKLDAPAVLKALPSDIKAFAYVVGRWVWIETPSKPEKSVRELLSDLGFQWNKERAVWQHPCGRFCKSAPYDPRSKYQILKPEEVESTN